MVWSLIVAGYALVPAQALWYVALRVGWTQVAHMPVQDSPLGPYYYSALGLVAIGSLIGAFLSIWGAYCALTQAASPINSIH